MTDVQIVTVPCLSDNYAYLIHDPASGATACVDVPDAAPIQAALTERGWQLSDILITHHHYDHIDGVAALVAATGAKVWGARADQHRLPPLDHALAEGDTFVIGKLSGDVIDVSGHTIGHIAFHFPGVGAAFTGDSLMALGCGRLFEGTPGQMWISLQKLRALPPETLIYSGHEYTLSNARFALSVDRENVALLDRIEKVKAQRAAGQPSVPAALGDEIATNPFLRVDVPEFATKNGLEGASAEDIFTVVRQQKDDF